MVFILFGMLGISVVLIFPTISEAQLEKKTFVTHSGGVISTTGEIIDPLYVASTMEFDPMKFLREFNYGKVSQLPDGSTLREFTIIAEDDKIMEISPPVGGQSRCLIDQISRQYSNHSKNKATMLAARMVCQDSKPDVPSDVGRKLPVRSRLVFPIAAWN